MSDTKSTPLANNLRYSVDGTTLTLIIDLETTVGPSKSGKMMGIANTGGFMPIPVTSPRGEEKAVKLNLYLGES